MTKLDDCIKTIDPSLIVFDSPTSGAGTPTSNFQSSNRPNHMGVDIAVPVETPIHAVEYGIVWRTISNHKDYGNCIIIRHTDSVYTLYAHLSDGAIDVKANECVEKGDIIGLSGNTGRSSGPHLHFEVLRLPVGVELAQQGGNKKGEPATGIKSTDYRIDPSFIFSPERSSLLEVTAGRSAKSSLLPGLAINGVTLWVVNWALNGPLALVEGWMQAAGALLAHGVATSATYFGVKSYLKGQERAKWDRLRESLGLLVTPEVVQKQLDKAEKSGRRSPNQQRKIEDQIRVEIDAARNAADGAARGLSELNSQLTEIRREIERTRSDAARSIDSAEAADRRRKDVATKLQSLAEREKAITEQAREVASGAKAAGERGAAAANRFEMAVRAREQHVRVERPEPQSRDQGNSIASEPLTVTEGSTFRTIILRAGEDIDSASDSLSTESDLPLRLP
ncbi:MAG: M23 family metallopeptidase [Pseudomonadota bacterium]